jgi:cob(I)alamin adenosyltransferase
MKIYTRTGDQGQTSFFGGERVVKSHPRVAAYGDVDELSASLGLAHAYLQSWPSLRAKLETVQRTLFGIGGEIATTSDRARERLRGLVEETDITALEESIDEMEADLPALTSFILPGGGQAGASLHLARTVCRRAERSVIALGERGPCGDRALPEPALGLALRHRPLREPARASPGDPLVASGVQSVRRPPGNRPGSSGVGGQHGLSGGGRCVIGFPDWRTPHDGLGW